MTPEERTRREERATSETLVIREIEDGFRVFAARNPQKTYIVGGEPNTPSCSCPDFQHHRDDPEWRCKHILAVFNRSSNGKTSKGEQTAPTNRVTPSPSGSRMLIKRSVSPDGRIDALSVELSQPIDASSPQAVNVQAEQALALSSDIVDGFLGRKSEPSPGSNHEPEPQDHPVESADRRTENGAVNAQLINIGGLDTQWGRRLFLNVQVNGRTLKLFGTPQRLAEAITAAGFPEAAECVDEGVDLHLPCRVTTKPSDDGRYVNVDTVLPAESLAGSR